MARIQAGSYSLLDVLLHEALRGDMQAVASLLRILDGPKGPRIARDWDGELAELILKGKR